MILPYKFVFVAVMKAPRASVLVWLLQISSRVLIPGSSWKHWLAFAWHEMMACSVVSEPSPHL